MFILCHSLYKRAVTYRVSCKLILLYGALFVLQRSTLFTASYVIFFQTFPLPIKTSKRL